MVATDAATDERPVDNPPETPLWSENYLFHAFDPESGFGVWLHLGLPSFDTGLWHGISIVYLPNRTESLVAKDFRARTPGGFADSGMLAAEFDCVRAEWVVRFRGAAQRVTVGDLDETIVSDAQVEPLQVELRFAGLSPALDLRGALSDQPWANAHWEQPCGVTGEISADGRTTKFTGAGVRDHSRGTRDLAGMGPHRFLHGQFPSGRCFGLIHMLPRETGGPAMSHRYLVDQGRLTHAEVIDVSTGSVLDRELDVQLRGADGEVRIHGEIVHDLGLTIGYPNEALLGTRPGATHVIREARAQWHWDGETGHGLAERSELRNPVRPA